jgi:hypothetical protein
MMSPDPWVRAAKVAGGVAVLTIVAVVLFALSAVGSGIATVSPGQPTSAAGASTPASRADLEAVAPQEVVQQAVPSAPGPGFAPALLAVCFLTAVAVAPVVVWSRWRGLHAALFLALLVYGQMTVLSQLETLVYLPQVSRAFVGRLFIFGAMFSVTLALAAVLILGRTRSPAAARATPSRPAGWPWWLSRVGAVAVLHVLVYYAAGYYLAWKNPVLRAFYGGSDPGSFLRQLQSIAAATPWMYAYQLAQGVLWALLVVVLVRMIAGSRVAVAVIAALFFGIVGPCQLLLPNPVMPTDVRLTHLVETVVSRLVFGFAAVWLLRPAGRFPRAESPLKAAARLS